MRMALGAKRATSCAVPDRGAGVCVARRRHRHRWSARSLPWRCRERRAVALRCSTPSASCSRSPSARRSAGVRPVARETRERPPRSHRGAAARIAPLHEFRRSATSIARDVALSRFHGHRLSMWICQRSRAFRCRKGFMARLPVRPMLRSRYRSSSNLARVPGRAPATGPPAASGASLRHHLELEVQPQVAEHVRHDLAAEMAAQRLQIGSEFDLPNSPNRAARAAGRRHRSPLPASHRRALAALEHQPCSGGRAMRMPSVDNTGWNRKWLKAE